MIVGLCVLAAVLLQVMLVNRLALPAGGAPDWCCWPWWRWRCCAGPWRGR